MQRRLLILLGIVTLLAIISPVLVVAFSLVVCSAGDHVPAGCAQGSGTALTFATFLFSLGLFLWVVTTLFGLVVITRRRQWGWLALVALTGPIGAAMYGLFIFENTPTQAEQPRSRTAPAPRPAGAVASALFDKDVEAAAPETVRLSAMPAEEPTPAEPSSTEPSSADGGEAASPETSA